MERQRHGNHETATVVMTVADCKTSRLKNDGQIMVKQLHVSWLVENGRGSPTRAMRIACDIEILVEVEQFVSVFRSKIMGLVATTNLGEISGTAGAQIEASQGRTDDLLWPVTRRGNVI
jgi:hypothetical protein